MLERRFYECFILLSLSQWIDTPTFISSGNILDIILSTEHDRITNVSTLPPLPGCHHSPVICSYNICSTFLINATESQNVKMWHKGNYFEINRYLSEVDWDFEFANINVNEAYDILTNITDFLVDLYVPMRSKTENPKPPWRVKPTRAIERKKNCLWDAYKNARSSYGRPSTQANEALESFNRINYEYRNFATISQVNFEKRMGAKSATEPKVLYGYVRHRKKGRPSVGPLKKNSTNSATTSNPKEMAGIFARAFLSVFNDTMPDNPHEHQKSSSSISNVSFTTEKIKKAAKKVKTDSSPGPDGMGPRLISCCPAIWYPLLLIFNLSMNTSTLPMTWKSSSIIPIFKKGLHSDPLNYRPISMTSICCKTMERIIAAELLEYLDMNSILSDSQFGFRPSRSTTDQLLLTYDYISESIDRGKMVDLILFDFAKAFDSVNHVILFTKLGEIGIGYPLLGWLWDFFSDRSMSVHVHGSFSDSFPVSSGVPQGSVLGPILFLIFINFVCDKIKCKFYLFADDLKLIISVPVDNTEDALNVIGKFQSYIDMFVDTARSWGLKLNKNKCQAMRFRNPSSLCLSDYGPFANYSIDSDPIRFTDSCTDLGVLIDTTLKFHDHIKSVARKASGVANNLLRFTICRDADFMVPLYKAHVRPIIEYASSLWNTGYITDLTLIEKVQRRWTKEIKGLYEKSYPERLKSLKLYSIYGRLLRSDLILTWKIFNGLSSIKPEQLFVLNSSSTRGHKFHIFKPRHHLECRARSFSCRIVNDWNDLPARVVESETLPQYKKQLADYLGDQLYAHF